MHVCICSEPDNSYIVSFYKGNLKTTCLYRNDTFYLKVIHDLQTGNGFPASTFSDYITPRRYILLIETASVVTRSECSADVGGRELSIVDDVETGALRRRRSQGAECQLMGAGHVQPDT